MNAIENNVPESSEVVLVQAERRPAMPPVEVESMPIASLVGACGKLSAALAMARDRCKMATKDKTNTFHKYAYASSDEIISTAKAALENTGLAIIPHSQRMTVQGVGNTAFYALNRTVILSHASGEYIPLTVDGWPVVLERGKTLDKAFATALTTSLSYLLRDLLQMPRGDEADMNARNDTPKSMPKQEPPAQPPEPTPLQRTMKAIENAATLDELKTAWLDRCKLRFTALEAAQLQETKDARKARLTPREPGIDFET